jgi:hypothetical protein
MPCLLSDRPALVLSLPVSLAFSGRAAARLPSSGRSVGHRPGPPHKPGPGASRWATELCPEAGAAFVLRVQRPEPVGIKVPDHIPHPVLAGERDPRDRGHVRAWADSSTICARRQVTTDPLPRRMIRTSRYPSPSSISRTRSPFSHRASLRDQHAEEKPQPGLRKLPRQSNADTANADETPDCGGRQG